MNIAVVILLGFITLGVTVAFWYAESKPWLDNMVIPDTDTNGIMLAINRSRCTIINVLRLLTDGKYLLFDLATTALLTSMFSLGGGITGGIIGAMTSNFVSVGIYFRMKQFNKHRRKTK